MAIVDINEEDIKNLLAKKDRKETKRRVTRSVKIFQIIFATYISIMIQSEGV